MLPRGIKLLWGLLSLYLGLIIYLVTNALVYLIYEEVPINSPLDPLMYSGLIVMVLGPLWFWVGRPVVHSFKEPSEGEG